MRRLHTVGLLGLLALGACEPGTAGPGVEAGLSLDVVSAPGLASAADVGLVHVEGPTDRTVTLQPGETQTVDQLDPGEYTVSIEAFVGGLDGQVESFGQTTVQVVAGEESPALVALTSFVPTGLAVPAQVVAGEPLAVAFKGVRWADGYTVQVADNPQFTDAKEQQVSGTSATLTMDTSGDYFVRVFARDRFGSDGLPATASRVTASPPATPLQDGAPLADRAGAQGSRTYYTFQVPEGPQNRVLQVRLRGGLGNADLAIRDGQDPTDSAFDCASAAPPGLYTNNLDFCSVLDPAPGTWHIVVKGTTAFESLVLDASLLPYTTVASGTPVGPLSGDVSDIQYFEIGVPQGASSSSSGSVAPGSDPFGAWPYGALPAHRSTPGTTEQTSGPLAVSGDLRLSLGGGRGDADLLASPRTAHFSLTTAGGWPCISLADGNDESCDLTDPVGGPWTVIVMGYAAFSGVSLQAQFVPPTRKLTVTGSGFGHVTGSGIDCVFVAGAGSGSCEADEPFGSTATLHPTPVSGFQFQGWGGDCTGTGDCTVTMDQDRAVDATFGVPSPPSISGAVSTIVQVRTRRAPPTARRARSASTTRTRKKRWGKASR
jgi:Bacterial pre-peptidase C-terminal domain/Divergent InlB B-repeat domain